MRSTNKLLIAGFAAFAFFAAALAPAKGAEMPDPCPALGKVSYIIALKALKAKYNEIPMVHGEAENGSAFFTITVGPAPRRGWTLINVDRYGCATQGGGGKNFDVLLDAYGKPA